MGGPSRRTPETATAAEDLSVRELAVRLASTDHPRLRARLDALADQVAAVARDAQGRHPEIVVALASAFTSLRTDVLAHLDRTDGVLLPALAACDRLDDAAPPGSPPTDEPAAARRAALAHAARSVSAGHGVIGAALDRLRTVTRGYAPPEGAAPPFRALYSGLAALERDLDAGFRSERELILPRAAALARTVPAPAGTRVRASRRSPRSS